MPCSICKSNGSCPQSFWSLLGRARLATVCSSTGAAAAAWQLASLLLVALAVDRFQTAPSGHSKLTGGPNEKMASQMSSLFWSQLEPKDTLLLPNTRRTAGPRASLYSLLQRKASPSTQPTSEPSAPSQQPCIAAKMSACSARPPAASPAPSSQPCRACTWAVEVGSGGAQVPASRASAVSSQPPCCWDKCLAATSCRTAAANGIVIAGCSSGECPSGARLSGGGTGRIRVPKRGSSAMAIPAGSGAPSTGPS
mmetsp:Transcript_4499/g.12434  ORF Transcript_4499/g.12434 Transcript_4499/m.12434 type:complete len:253 (+) Transcript_4499:419-1177(+)